MNKHLFAAVALALSTGAAAQVPPDPAALLENLADVEILALRADRYRRVTVPVTIGANGPYRFMIDTGAQATVLSRQLADSLQLLDRKPATLVGMASSRPVEITEVPDFGLGARRFNIQTAALVEQANIGGADGIIGLDGLQEQRVLFDFEKMEIAVANASSLGGNRGFEIIVRARAKLGQLIITDARIDGIPVSVIVDTGAQGSIGNPALQARLRRMALLGDNEVTDINGQSLSGSVKLARKLEIGEGVLSNLPVLFADSPMFHALDLVDKPALMLGMNELRLFRRVAIDFKSRRVLFDLPSRSSWEERRFSALDR